MLVGQGDKYEIWDEVRWIAQRESMFVEELDESLLTSELETLSF